MRRHAYTNTNADSHTYCNPYTYAMHGKMCAYA